MSIGKALTLFEAGRQKGHTPPGTTEVTHAMHAQENTGRQ
jgi:hypothetical protein